MGVNVTISAPLLYAAIAAGVSLLFAVVVLVWRIFDFQRKEILEPLKEMSFTQEYFKREVKELKEAIGKVEHELKTRLTIKDGTPIEEVIEKMSEQFDLMVDRDLFNFYLDSQAKYECDVNGLCVRVNEKYSTLTGITEHQAIGNGWLTIIHPSDQKRVFNMWEDFVIKDFPFDCRYTIVTREKPEGIRVHGRAFSKRDGENIRLILGTVEPI